MYVCVCVCLCAFCTSLYTHTQVCSLIETINHFYFSINAESTTRNGFAIAALTLINLSIPLVTYSKVVLDWSLYTKDMALKFSQSQKYSIIQKIFLTLGFFPHKFGSKNSLWFKVYQRILYLIILPATFFIILNNSAENPDKSYINRLAKKCILVFSFITFWVTLCEADATNEDQATIFSKLNEINFSWATQKIPSSSQSSRLYRHLILLTIFNVLIFVLAIGTDFQGLNTLSRVLNFLIHLRCIQIYFFKRCINGKLEAMKPVEREMDQTIFDLKLDTVYAKAEKIKRSLLKIREINFYLNKCIGWSLLFILSHWLIIFTCHFYWIYITINVGKSGSTIEGSLLAILPKVVLLYLMANEIWRTNEHVSLLHQKLTHKFETFTDKYKSSSTVASFFFRS